MTEAIATFGEHVKEGLSAQPKYLSSRYFYDEIGDRLFQKIMNLKEYYPTRCEFEIFTQNKEEICKEICACGDGFDLVELGAGDGLKTKILLKELLNQKANFTYRPVDISSHAIKHLLDTLRVEFPSLSADGLVGEYFEVLQGLKKENRRPKVILFLGSNIGNFHQEQAKEFLKGLRAAMNDSDKLLIGVDLKKDPQVIMDAYHDSSGVTAAFNLNLLTRMNRELGADFNLDAFAHFPTYDPPSGEMKSYIVSKKTQEIRFAEIDYVAKFETGEVIYTELSKKFGRNEISELANETGFETSEWFLDCKHWFTDVILEPK